MTDFTPARRPGPGRDRPVDRVPRPAPAGPPSRSGSSPTPSRAKQLPEAHLRRGDPRRIPNVYEGRFPAWLDARPRLAPTGGARTGRGRRVPTTRGRATSTTAASSRTARRGARSRVARAAARRARRRAASSSRRPIRAPASIPSFVGPVAVGLRTGSAPLPARVGGAVGVAVRRRRRHRSSQAHADADARDRRRHPRPRPTPDRPADARTDPDARHPRRSSRTSPAPAAGAWLLGSR